MNFFYTFIFSLQRANIYRHAYIYNSNDFDLCKIQFMQNHQEENNCIIQGAPEMEDWNFWTWRIVECDEVMGSAENWWCVMVEGSGYRWSWNVVRERGSCGDGKVLTGH
jgi:hypothetical protein